jgi:predicted permease
MNKPMNWWQRLWRKPEQEKRLDQELRFHFESQVAVNIRAGMTEEEARRRARLEFGALESVKEECREARGTALVESTWQDLRYSLRTLRKTPAFTIAAIATLALGIGANTAIFQLLDAVRLRSLPVPNPQQLATIQLQNGSRFGISNDSHSLTFPLWEEIRRHQQAFSGVFAWRGFDDVRFGEGPQARRVAGLLVSGELFPALELTPAAGRLFHREDDQHGCTAPGVILSYTFWQSEFAGRAAAIGSRVTIADHPFEVIGVAPPRFQGLDVGKKFDIAMPMCAAEGASPEDFTRRDLFWLRVMGRLHPGWSVARTSSHLAAISPGLFEATLPTGYSAQSLADYKKMRLEATPAANGISDLRDQYNTSLWLLLGITGLVLLIACANLGNLMLARAGAHQREFAVRLALGASRSRLMRQSLSESLLLAFTGAALGFGLARVLSASMVWFLTIENEAPQLDLSTDWRMLAFTAAAATLACVLFGLAPALRSSHTEPGAVIKSGGRGLTAGRERFSFQRFLVVIQISVSLVLVVGALLFVRSFRNLMTLDPGFREQGILLAFIDLSHLRLPPSEIKSFDRRLLDEIRSIPQVEGAASTTNVIVGGGMWSHGIQIGDVMDTSRFTWVSPGYFRALDTPVLSGRDFNDGDLETSPHVAIVNQTFIRHFLGGADPIGKTLRTSPEPGYPATEYQIIGVCKDTRYFDLRSEIPPMVYAPATQFPRAGPWMNLYIRSSAPLGTLSAAIGRELGKSHPAMTVEFRVFQEQIENGFARDRLMAALSGFFGALAALLAAVGIYGVIAYLVARRQNEMGIRIAIGSTRPQVIALVMREAALVVAVGVGIGLAGSLVLARFAASLLFGLQARDPLTLLGAALLLAAVAALAAFLPALRASRVDPMAALRYE